MPEWLRAEDATVVASIERDGHSESVHHGIAVVVDSQGAPLLEVGNPQAVVYPRSTLKPLQTLAVLRTGVELTDQEIALATASHSGSTRHRDAVSDFLRRHVLSPDLLQCPADWPLSTMEKAALIAEGGTKSVLAMNCSGKHTGFLAACQHRGDPLQTYLEPSHPLQRDIRAAVEELTGETIAYSSVDGCGAPLHALSLHGLARGLSALVTSDEPEAQRIVQAVGAHPWAIAGENHPNTRVIETLGGIAKIGAEGLLVIALPSGITAAVKILDGSMRATTPVALEALAVVGAIEANIVQNLRAQLDEPVLAGARVAGGLVVTLGDGAEGEKPKEGRRR